MLCTGLFPNADTKIQHRRRPTCPLWYDKYQLCTIWLNYVYFCMWFKYGLKSQKLQKFQKQHALKGQKLAKPGDTQVAQSAYPSGSIRILIWFSQLTQTVQSASQDVSKNRRIRLR